MKRIIILILATAVLTGCMTTRNGNKSDNIFPSGDRFNNKRVAILPVKSQTSLTTDSQTPLKKALNNKIVQAVKAKLPNTQIIDPQKTLDVLNDAGKIDLIEKMLSAYESTGTFDKKLVANISSSLNSDFLVLTKLKVEKLDLSFIAKSFTGSLEIILLDKRSSEPLWSGIGDFKRMGTYGTGGTETDEAASELVTLALGQPIDFSQQKNELPVTKPTSEIQAKVTTEEKAIAPVTNIADKSVEKKQVTAISQQPTTSSVTSMVVTNNKAKLRQKPSANSGVVKSLKKGNVVQLIKERDGWCLIELASGETGWCQKALLATMN